MKEMALPVLSVLLMAGILASAVSSGTAIYVAVAGVLLVGNVAILGLRIRDVLRKQQLDNDANSYGAHAA